MRSGEAKGRLRRAIDAARAFARGSPWTSLAARCFATCVALVVLACLGRSTPGCASGEAVASERTPAHDPPTSAIAVALDASVAPPASPAPSAGAPAPAGSRASPESPVYLNQATADDLERLPGVGPKRAAAILALRQRIGRFQRVEDLLRVKGVGRATLKKWRPLVRLDAPAGDAGA